MESNNGDIVDIKNKQTYTQMDCITFFVGSKLKFPLIFILFLKYTNIQLKITLRFYKNVLFSNSINKYQYRYFYNRKINTKKSVAEI